MLRPEPSGWLSTGQAAKLCSVERDTVLKWIKRGRLVAERTAGGHFRIDPSELSKVASGPFAQTRPQEPMRCWEYLSAGGELPRDCQDCLVYRVGATWCFLLRELKSESSCCRGPDSCEDCAYYRRAAELPTRVLVVTEDEALRRSLSEENCEDLAFCVVRNAYEAAMAVDRFHPGFAVVDEDVDRRRGRELLEMLRSDGRSPGLKLVYAVRPGRNRRGPRACLGPQVAAVLTKPFGPGELRELVARYAVETKRLTEEQGVESPAAREGVGV